MKRKGRSDHFYGWSLVGLIIFTLVSGAAFKCLSNVWFPAEYGWVPAVFASLTALASLVAAASWIGILLAPLHYLGILCTTLRNWKENRILEELTCTGLTSDQVVDQMTAHILKRLFLLVYPSLTLLSIGLLVLGERVLFLQLLLYLPLSALATVLGGFCLYTWSMTGGKRGLLLTLAPATLLSVVPFGLGLAASEVRQPLWWQVALFLSLCFVGWVSHRLTRLALRSAANIENFLTRMNGLFLIKKTPGPSLSDNAVAARQEMAGQSLAHLFSILALAGLGLEGIWIALELDSPYPLYFALCAAGFVGAWRAAGSMSQIITHEMESRTLETLRTSPLGSQRFLNGWLRITLQPLWVELTGLTALLLPFELYLGGTTGLMSGQFFYCAALAGAFPFIGALFGASIAAQCKPRQEVNGQISLSFVVCLVFIVPQLTVVLALSQCWLHLLLLGPFFWFLCWLLRAGAEKSLNRVFLPQN